MKLDASKICFGLTEELDQQSLSTFLQLCGRAEFARELSTRVSEEETIALVDHVMALIRKHFSENEYHRLFLNDHHHHDHDNKE
ncbi:hypothetical protein [Desulforhopalus sp. IMCC35007]|uniref:hypothetical protein n=1 Tax=Desulforhopalus sp. IMCC35007 TaxID=2569543 RepID=UPI0010AE8970|nr:hypothetical protein [Desulforhopalus sp. IMCC35007]TKB12183.1 hypothetical protein FCL48_00600 [Desulforhopalus sp. IMCC35007]